MHIALAPYMYRHLSLGAMVDKAAELGYDYIELSPREDFMPFYKYPRVDRARIREFRKALSDAGVKLCSLLPLYLWAAPDEDLRIAAVRNWKRAIQVAVEMDCDLMNTEFSGQSDHALVCENQSASGHRAGRGGLGRVLLDIVGDQFRRYCHSGRICLGGARR